MKDGWTYIGISFMALYYPTNKDESLYQSKMCAYMWGPQSYEKSSCGILLGHYYSETWQNPKSWETRIGGGLVGFIKAVYLWNFYKSLTNMYYTPRRNSEYRRVDRCSPYPLMGNPVCAGCDQYKGASTCFTSCNTNTYESFYSSNKC